MGEYRVNAIVKTTRGNSAHFSKLVRRGLRIGKADGNFGGEGKEGSKQVRNKEKLWVESEKHNNPIIEKGRGVKVKTILGAPGRTGRAGKDEKT